MNGWWDLPTLVAGTVLGNKAALPPRGIGGSPGEPFGGNMGYSGLDGEDHTAEAAFPAMNMWKPVLPALLQQPALSKGG